MNGNTIVILGAGESGVGAALLAQAKGFDVFVSDFGTISSEYRAELAANNIAFEENKHSEEIIFSAKEVVKSPGIPDSIPLIVSLREKGMSVISEIEFAYRYTDAKFITITGSNGKTTTTLLTYHLLSEAGFEVALAGNVGTSLARQVIDGDYDYIVTELSSFQLDGMYEFKSHIAILLNITPDHLDRYDYDFQKYVDSKFRITQNMSMDNYFISFSDDPVIQKELLERAPKAFRLSVSLEDSILNGGYLKNNKLMFNINNHFSSVFSLDCDDLPLKGKHNMVNCISAIMAARAAGVSESQIHKHIQTFENASHRMEEVALINGVRYVNDSKATNVDSVKYAIDSYEKPIIWIAGGVDKGNDYSVLEEMVYEKVTTLICLGKDTEKLKASFKGKVIRILDANNMAEAVELASELAESGGVVLLSPACASFDMFKNYEDRGRKFVDAVKSLNVGSGKLMSLML